ncbi:transcriptional regulator, PadR family [Sphingomonas gellani]|uniref:Transcriptional regulator, PadR family n=1 Tax=Sphingomonas gellani TaxID=1166340 RepID=A0A1H8EHH6_9SPHN|nr:PadR family transcriptional regulator [Sphingomonas gellani]SEN18949.1 transcriptional regulator, PadR family [Sphingomonas gellani]
MRFHFHGMGSDQGGHRRCGPRGHRFSFGPFGFDWATEGHHRDGGRRRRFEGGELRLILLRLIADDTRHGYELIRAIGELTGGAYAPSPGVVYPTLTLLDEMGLIAQQQSDDAKKRFAITDAGQEHLAERQEEVDALMRRLGELGAREGHGGGSPVWRAMRNLGLVIRSAKAAGDLSEERMHEIVDMIDDVARRIERLK